MSRLAALALALAVCAAGIAVAVLIVASESRATRGADRAPGADVQAFHAAHASLCRAAQHATATDTEAARRTFTDEAHQPLHDLAGSLEATDRSAAARLLEAKQRVEADLTGKTVDLASDLRQLAAVTSDAIASGGRPTPPPCSP